jgi:iron complex outermembrane receptor protein
MNHKTVKQCKWISALAVSSSLISVQSFAQDTYDVVLEEIIVTAQKREANVQDVPISISVFDSKNIERLAANTLSDLEFASPGVIIDSDSLGGLSIRGVGGFARNVGTEGRSGVYVDDVFVGRAAGVDQSLMNIERVEILKGPQGTLFGRNTVSGAINITTKKPSEEFEGMLSAEYGSRNRVNVAGMVNIPLVEDKFYIRASGNHIQQDGYVDNLFTGEDVGSKNISSGRLQALYLVNDNLDVLLNAEVRSSKKDSIGFQLFNDIDTIGSNAVSHNAIEFDDNNIFGVSSTINYTFSNDFSLTSITAYREEDFLAVTDEDGSTLDAVTSDFQEDNKQFTQEFRLESPRMGNVDFLAGLYYINQELTSDKRADAGPDFFAPNIAVLAPGAIDLESYAGFLHSNVYLTDQFTVTAGLRYTRESKDADYSITDPTGFLYTNGSIQDSETWDAWSPSLSARYRFSEDVMVYGTVSRGFKAGGYNLDFLSSLEQVKFDPETVTNYEAGFKADLWDKRARLNVSAYYMDFSDYQVFQFITLPNGGTIIALTNAAEVSSKGIETELNVQVMRDLTLSAAYSYINAKYSKFPDGGGLGVDLDGQYIGNSPDHSLYFAADYSLDVGDIGSANFHADFSYTNGYDKFISVTLSEPLGSVETLNARVEFLTPEQDWALAVWGRNLLNDNSLTDVGYNFLGSRYGSFRTPREFGVSLKREF